MKNVMKYVSVICLIVVVGVLMTACGGGNNSEEDIQKQQEALKNSVQGVYANIDDYTDMYYIYGDKYLHGVIKIEEKNGKKVVRSYAYDETPTKNELTFGTQVVNIVKNGYGATDRFIDCRKAGNENVAEKFTAENGKTYQKISSLTEFLLQIEPNIDFTDLTGVNNIWQDLFQA